MLTTSLLLLLLLQTPPTEPDGDQLKAVAEELAVLRDDARVLDFKVLHSIHEFMKKPSGQDAGAVWLPISIDPGGHSAGVQVPKDEISRLSVFTGESVSSLFVFLHKASVQIGDPIPIRSPENFKYVFHGLEQLMPDDLPYLQEKWKSLSELSETEILEYALNATQSLPIVDPPGGERLASLLIDLRLANRASITGPNCQLIKGRKWSVFCSWRGDLFTSGVGGFEVYCQGKALYSVAFQSRGGEEVRARNERIIWSILSVVERTDEP